MQYLTPRTISAYAPSNPFLGWLSPRRVLLWTYVARFALSAAVFIAAVFAWQIALPRQTLVASVMFIVVLLFTTASAFYTEVYRRPITDLLLYLQIVFDVVLVTTVVHITWDGYASQFAPLYILVTAVAALLLPARGVTMISALAITLYVGDVIWIERVNADMSVVLQLFVFGIVAIGSGLIAGRLREAGRGGEALAEELVQFRLRQGDVERLHLRAERLEAVAELSASMAHEIKNPLASIRSAVEQLSLSPRTTDDERVLTSLVQRESDRLTRLLTGFLDFARLDVPHVRRLDLAHVVANAGVLAQAHPEKGAGVVVEYDLPRNELEVEGDEDMLHRAFFNLILNAVQASPADGVVRLEATTLLPYQVAAYQAGAPPVTPRTIDEGRAPDFSRGAVAVRIIDQGAGIPPEVRSRLFHPFYSTKSGGSGLGLAVVHRVIEAHRGVVVVESDAKAHDPRRRGARFTVLLPRP